MVIICIASIQTIMKIDKTTGKIYALLKGKLNDFSFINDPYNGFSHQHAPEELTVETYLYG